VFSDDRGLQFLGAGGSACCRRFELDTRFSRIGTSLMNLQIRGVEELDSLLLSSLSNVWNQ